MRDLTTSTAQIVAALAASSPISTDGIIDAIHRVHSALAGLDLPKIVIVQPAQAAAPAVETEAAAPPVEVVEEPRKPFTDIEKSITHDRLICLDCGDQVILLARHLKRKHGLSPVEYRHRWKLDRDYPMTSSAYAAQKRELAVAAGFGQSVRPPARGSKAAVVEDPKSTRRRLKPAFRPPVKAPKLTVVEERQPQLVD